MVILSLKGEIGMENRSGFSLIELIIVVAIIALLAMIAIPSFSRFLAKSKRSEAYINLHSLYAAQKAYWAEHGSYTSNLSGSGCGWKPEGYHGGGETENFYYTYGFPGAEGVSSFTGKLKTSSSHLSHAKAGTDGFIAIAAGDIDGDGKPDILAVDQFNNIRIIEDDLAD